MLVDVRFVRITEYDTTIDIPKKDIENLKNGDGAYFFENVDFMNDFEILGDVEWNYELLDPETFEIIVPFG